MSFCHRHRKAASLIALASFVVASAATSTSGEYNPHLGRFMQRDPNGTGMIFVDGPLYHGANPTVTVSMAYQLQFGDGLNFYEYLRSNPGNRRDPTGLFSYADLLARSAAYGAMAGGTLGWMRSYATFSDYDETTGGGSLSKQAAAMFFGAGVGMTSSMAAGLLAGAIASAGGVSIGVAASAVGLMTMPTALGLAIQEYEDAETYADQLMAKIDMGAAGLGMLTAHVGAFGGAFNLPTRTLVQQAAQRAIQRVGGGAGHEHGSRVHTAFAAEVARLGRNLTPEVSYYMGKVKDYGYPGSIRVDAVEGPVDFPLTIYDLKTGGATLSNARVNQIRTHLPKGYDNIPIVEIRVEGP